MTATRELPAIRVGDRLPVVRPPEISRAMLALFAGASNDHNPIHIDLDAARDAGRPDVFAQGMLSMAFVARSLTAWVPQHRIRSLGARFLAITPVHAQVEVVGEVTALVDGVATVELSVRLADGTVTISATAQVDTEDSSCT
ncbi:MaoC/PaaZ C-terminal domain-containing protein [Nocardioides sp. QY071]|uniref:MaoC/PaaZ C-terminal domain-containing protein n=1 Tax=Nocardioides sp. QY071 TaxID=3044187 RepID=UPI00249B377D|nr:MaoC/PaaZ C-terminal domain-containing protein [Nocardioides sp. QY071]WGY00393.1 MaoC/PaaZ C-terminal domain-containing protein [Nocardioides sp. QY071]